MDKYAIEMLFWAEQDSNETVIFVFLIILNSQCDFILL